MHLFRDGPFCNLNQTGDTRINLVGGYQTLVDQDVFEKLGGLTWHSDAKGYVLTGKTRLHRLIMWAVDGQEVDHINGNALDNRRANLRLCTKAQNHSNQRKAVGKSSRYLGVAWHKHNRRWAAYITIDQKQKTLGYFRREQDAALAYDTAALAAWGAFARPNFPNVTNASSTR